MSTNVCDRARPLDDLDRDQDLPHGLTRERLRAYFLEDRYLVRAALLSLADAARTAQSDESASLSFLHAMNATELAVRRAFLEPIIIGWLRNVAGSILMARLLASANGPTHLVETAFHSLSAVVGFNVWDFRREGGTDILWVEIRSLKTLRAGVLDKVEYASTGEARAAISVASAVLYELFPRLLESIGLHVHEEGRICEEASCKLQAH